MKFSLITIAAAMALSFGAYGQVSISEAEAKASSKVGVGVENKIITENPAIPTTTTLRNVPGFAMSGPASGPCNGFSAGGAGVGAGFGIGLNFSKVDEDCSARETARLLAMIGKQELALEMLQTTDAWQRHVERKAAAQPKRAETPAPAVQRTAGIQQPTNCTADPYIAVRTGMQVCK